MHDKRNAHEAMHGITNSLTTD